MTHINLINGDCLIKLKELEDNSIDAIITDPPYELGFMGKYWDSTGISNNKEMWSECLRILKPGAYLLAFSGTRTYHRMASAIEDAGFEVRDMIEWVYGSGFPKSLNIGKAVDKLQGNEREVVGSKKGQGSIPNDRGNWGLKPNEDVIVDKGTSEYEGWGTALKPAHEPICMARKPLSEKNVAENCLKWGTGGINIDESRVGFDMTDKSPATNPLYRFQNKDKYRQVTDNGQHEGVNVKFTNSLNPLSELGRFPANLIHDNSEEVRECFPDTKSQGHWSKTITKGFGEFGNGSSEYLGVGEKDKEGGNASRFFKSIIYQAKASKSERNIGCEDLEPKVFSDRNPELDSADMPQNRSGNPKSNFHPTVKPIALMEYLIKMVTKKDGIILDQFMGSGTTGVACVNTNRNFIGIELDEKYFEIAKKRIERAKNLGVKI